MREGFAAFLAKSFTIFLWRARNIELNIENLNNEKGTDQIEDIFDQVHCNRKSYLAYD